LVDFFVLALHHDILDKEHRRTFLLLICIVLSKNWTRKYFCPRCAFILSLKKYGVMTLTKIGYLEQLPKWLASHVARSVYFQDFCLCA